MSEIFEIINPSDSYTIVGERDVACAATMLLGGGKYALEDMDGKQACPIFFSGDPFAWFKETFGHEFEAFVKDNSAKLADCLDTVLIGSKSAREEYEEATAAMNPEQVKAFTEKRHERRRTSMNNIGGSAQSLARRIRAKIQADEAEEKTTTGQQK
jgi:hypothetical protein